MEILRGREPRRTDDTGRGTSKKVPPDSWLVELSEPIALRLLAVGADIHAATELLWMKKTNKSEANQTSNVFFTLPSVLYIGSLRLLLQGLLC
jgi:hypothetical protein